MANKNRLYPEPGLWVADDRDGLPKIEPPEPLADGKISAVDLRDEQIAYHGLGFCIYSYIPPEKIEDIPLRKLWQRAQRAMREIVIYLESATPKPKKGTILKRKRETDTVIGEKLL